MDPEDVIMVGWKWMISNKRIKHQAPVVKSVDNTIHRINHYPLDIAIGFTITYLVDSDLSGG